MSKKKTGAIPTTPPKSNKNKVTVHVKPSFGRMPKTPRGGAHMTEKDRPRKRDWKHDDWEDI